MVKLFWGEAGSKLTYGSATSAVVKILAEDRALGLVDDPEVGETKLLRKPSVKEYDPYLCGKEYIITNAAELNHHTYESCDLVIDNPAVFAEPLTYCRLVNCTVRPRKPMPKVVIYLHIAHINGCTFRFPNEISLHMCDAQKVRGGNNE